MQEEAGGGALSTPLIGGRVTLSLCVWREWGAWRIPQPTPPKKKNAVAQGEAAGVAQPVQGYTIPVCKDSANECRICQACLSIYAECSLSSVKIVQMSAEYAKLA